MEQPSQTSKKRSGTVAGMKDGLKKATTDMLVLFLLRQKPMYAYEMLQEMARLSDGVLQLTHYILLSIGYKSTVTFHRQKPLLRRVIEPEYIFRLPNRAADISMISLQNIGE